jgi:hypothetical protein
MVKTSPRVEKNNNAFQRRNLQKKPDFTKEEKSEARRNPFNFYYQRLHLYLNGDLLSVDDTRQVDFWNSQTASPSMRKFLRKDGTPTAKFSAYHSGHANSHLTNDESIKRKKQKRAKISKTLKVMKKDHKNEYIKETSAIRSIISIVTSYAPTFMQYYKIIYPPSFIAGDLIFENLITGISVPVQIKSVTYKDGQLSFCVKKQDGLSGGRYIDIPIICVAADFLDTSSDGITDCDIREIYVFNSPLEMPTKGKFQPYSKQENSAPVSCDSFRYSFTIDNDLDLKILILKFIHTIERLTSTVGSFRTTARDVMYKHGPSTWNRVVSVKHVKKLDFMWQITELHPFIQFSHPTNQCNAYDLIVAYGGIDMKISTKYASLDHADDAFRFEKGVSDSSSCDIIWSFRGDNVWVFKTKYVFSTNTQNWRWTSSRNHGGRVFKMNDISLFDYSYSLMH